MALKTMGGGSAMGFYRSCARWVEFRKVHYALGNRRRNVWTYSNCMANTENNSGYEEGNNGSKWTYSRIYNKRFRWVNNCDGETDSNYDNSTWGG